MQIRKVCKHELAQAAELANKVFRSNRSPIMGSAFPALFQPGIVHSFGAFDDQGKLRAFMGMAPLQIRTEAGVVNAFAIGSVCTDPEFRGAGLASTLLEQCQAYARISGAPLLFISGDRSLYTRNGAAYFGQSLRFELHAGSLIPQDSQKESPYIISDFTASDIFTLHRLLEQKPAALGWSVAELEQYVDAAPYAAVSDQIPCFRTAASSSGEFVGIAMFSIPSTDTSSVNAERESKGRLLEWAGEPESIIAILHNVLSSQQLDGLTITLPWQDQALSSLLQSYSSQPVAERNAGTVMIVDGPELLRQLGHDGQADLTAEELCSCLFDPRSPYRKEDHSSLPLVPLPYMYGLFFI